MKILKLRKEWNYWVQWKMDLNTPLWLVAIESICGIRLDFWWNQGNGWLVTICIPSNTHVNLPCIWHRLKSFWNIKKLWNGNECFPMIDTNWSIFIIILMIGRGWRLFNQLIGIKEMRCWSIHAFQWKNNMAPLYSQHWLRYFEIFRI